MKYYKRQLSTVLEKAVKTFPAILVTGPRQSGKTTLLRKEFGNTANFVSLEEPDKRLWAKDDPRGFLDHYGTPVIIDEFQYSPDILPYIKERIDKNRAAGSYLLTGSQQFGIMKNVSESLAGRVAVTTLLPFSLSEIKSDLYRSWTNWLSNLIKGSGKKTGGTHGDIMMQGQYPELVANNKIDKNLWFSSYTRTYLERDVKTVYDIGHLDQFTRFLSLLAARCAGILNYSSFASDIGVSVPTIRHWFSILEASFIVFKLMPYHTNIGKRIIKSPKFYFYDTGLAAYLAGLNSPDYLVRGNTGGQFFKNLVVSEFFKNKISHNENINMYFINYRNLWEIDLLIEQNLEVMPVEIKLSATINNDYFENFKKLRESIKNISANNILICNSESMKWQNNIITSWRYL